MKKMGCLKEFKVRMDQVKCEKYRTFQPELPTKKFMFSDEKESIHNMKLLSDDSSDQNKATITEYTEKENVKETDLKQKPKELKKKPEEIRKAITGMFRDNKRRIDLVLVIKDNFVGPVNNIKMDFLSYIVKVGLEVEIEPGITKIHKNLTFIKIHAPNSILEKFGKFFGTKRYFAETRYDNMKKNSQNEKEWLMLVRNNYETPNGYSNYERSIIVYKILVHLSFGDNANYYGIERLLSKKVIIDVFALHDGPYFITPNQTISGSNARQILNYYWSGVQNIFQQQPLQLIHEYFGPRLACYFAFYEFFNKALKIAAFIGIFMINYGTQNLEKYEKDIKTTICKTIDNICGYCDDWNLCPKRRARDYCTVTSIHLVLDHRLIPVYSVATVVGTFLFLRLWQRKEYFLKWMWEVGRHDSYYKNAVRPLFNIGYGARTHPLIDGFQYSKRIAPIFFRNVISKAILLTYWYNIVPVMYGSYQLYYTFFERIAGFPSRPRRDEKYMDYIIMAMFYILYIFLITVVEKIYHYIVYFLAKCENHSSYKEFYNSIAIKKIGLKMVLQYGMIAYFAWLHGSSPRFLLCYPPNNWSTYTTFRYVIKTVYDYDDYKICQYRNFCFPYTCIIEVSILLATLLIVSQVVYKIFDYIFCLRTDYNQRWCCLDMPCWEREYRLSSVTEEVMVQKYLNLAAQLCLVTWFVIGFPLSPVILYLINTWDIRHEARKLLLASRRPLLIKTPGTEMTKIFYFIATIAVLTNAINIATLTRSKTRYLMPTMPHPILEKKKQKVTNKDIFLHANGWFHYPYCYAPSIMAYNTQTKFHDTYWSYFFCPSYYSTFLYGSYHFIVYIFAVVCFVSIILYITPRQRDVEIARRTEEKIRSLYYHYEYEYKHSKDT